MSGYSPGPDDSGGTWLEPTPVRPLSGEERFRGADARVVDFWRWGFSDLRENIVRGVLAEFLVARAVGAKEEMRAAWDNFDVQAPGGARIEVKSSAYLQSWSQRRPSKIRFAGLTGRTWHAKQGWGPAREVRADVFVFAVHTYQEPADYDPTDVSQWEFHVLPARAVREHGGRSVGLPFLTAHGAGVVRWAELAREIGRAYGIERSDAPLEQADDASPTA
ncbi:MAG TPA: hypothetical protein VK285_06535 [Gaiellaceae bacterium]|nr:hypothetical protein [Gaiellaceae bacterium]